MTTAKTKEYRNGQMVSENANFQDYASPGASSADYWSLLNRNKAYRDVLAAPDFDSAITAMGRSGYATDPNYANKLRGMRFGDEYTTARYNELTQAGAPEHIAKLGALQSALETGYGKHQVGNNLYGIKANKASSQLAGQPVPQQAAGLGVVGATGAPVVESGVQAQYQPPPEAPRRITPIEKLTGLKPGFAAEWLEKNYGLGPGFAVQGREPATTPEANTSAGTAPTNATGGQKAAGLGLALASALGGGSKQRAPVEAAPMDTNNYQAGFAQANDRIFQDLQQRIAERWRSSMEMQA